jgi:uncharacterized membrane protein
VSVPAAPLPAFERTLVRLMLAGVWTSSAILATGLGLLLASRVPAAGDALLRVGLVVLMATPVMRVALSVAEAIRQRDWFWLWSTVAVVVVLIGTMVYSLRV